MYTETDFQNAKKQTRVRVAGTIVLSVLFFALVLFLNRRRLQYAAMAVGAVGFMAVYFVCSFKVSPWVKYNRFLREMQNGQRRRAECEFLYFTPETRLHDGVEVHEMIVTVGAEEADERLYYWDADKPMPALQKGDRVAVESFGNFVVSLAAA